MTTWRSRVRGTFEGIRLTEPVPGIKKKNIMLSQVTDFRDGKNLGDILVGYGKNFTCLGKLVPGDEIAFDARITYNGNGTYRLTYPSKAIKVEPGLSFTGGQKQEQDSKPKEVSLKEIRRIRAEVNTARYVIAFRRQFVEMAGDFRAGAMLSQIWYWFDNADGTNHPRATFRDMEEGHLWLNKSHNDWVKELGLSEWEARNAVKKLVDMGLVITKVLQTPWHESPSTCLRLNWPVVARRYKETLKGT